MNITLSTSGNIGIMLVNKLFDLNYLPNQLCVWCTSEQHNAELIDFCNRRQISVTHIDTLGDFDQISKFTDLLLSIAGVPYLIPDHIINRFPLGGVNLHPADTEKYRGRWMVSWCMINQEPTVGYTWHYMNNRYDTGNILLKQNFTITEQDTALSLNARIFSHAIYYIEKLLNLIGTPGETPTHIGKYYNKSMPYGGVIHPNWSMESIDRFIRAMYHPPYAPAILEKNGKIHYINNINEFIIAQNT
jgi:methionyl-tRNA formyltransferase